MNTTKIKKILPIAALTILTPLSIQSHADTVLGVYAGAGIWNADYSGDAGKVSVDLDNLGINDEDNNFYYVALEHPIPLIPNIKLQHTEITSKGNSTVGSLFKIDNVSFSANQAVSTDLDLSHTDATFYYEVLDNWVNLDLGLTLRDFDGSVEVRSSTQSESVDLDGILPMLYAKAQFDLPFTGWSAGADANLVTYSGNSINDFSAKVAYTSDVLPLLDMGLELGYRRMTLELDDVDDLETDLTIDGPYIALTIHF